MFYLQIVYQVGSDYFPIGQGNIAAHFLYRVLKITAVFLFLITILSPPPVQAESNCLPDGIQDSGAIYRICMPPEAKWNGDLIVFAHGYVAYNEPIAIPEDQLIIDGVSLAEVANDLGFAFATTSYSSNGLAVRHGLEDVVDVVNIFSETQSAPTHVYLAGASEGGIITALAMEQYDHIFDGGLSACGPVGNFRWQLNYWGDVRIIFDYFFPSLLPGSPINIPTDVIKNWDSVHQPQIEAALRAAPEKTSQLLQVAKIPTNPANPEDNIDAIVDLLWYNVFATNDGIAKLGGQPFENLFRYYFGSADDGRLNREVARFRADKTALTEVQNFYQSSGVLGGPLITLHTFGDPIVPYWHEPIYSYNIFQQDATDLHVNIPIFSQYGHCNFTTTQVLFALVLLLIKTNNNVPLEVNQYLTDPADRKEYERLMAEYGSTSDTRTHMVYLPIVTVVDVASSENLSDEKRTDSSFHR